jgi:hypothetical protein
MKFFYPSLKSLQTIGGAAGKDEAPPCSDWKGKKARLYFYGTKTKPYAGELATIMFF